MLLWMIEDKVEQGIPHWLKGWLIPTKVQKTTMILQEWGLAHIIVPKPNNRRTLLLNHIQIEQYVEGTEFLCLILPKFHCELKPKNMYGVSRSHPDLTFAIIYMYYYVAKSETMNCNLREKPSWEAGDSAVKEISPKSFRWTYTYSVSILMCITWYYVFSMLLHFYD